MRSIRNLIPVVALLLAGIEASGCKSDAVGPLEGAGAGVSPDPALQPSEANNPIGGANEDLATHRTSAPVGSSAVEVEPNDTPQTAMSIPAHSAVRGVVGSAKDVDWFRVVPGGRSQMRVEVSGIESVDLELSLHDVNGDKLWRKIDNFGVGEGEVITNFVVEESCLLKIKPKGKGAYTDVPYTLAVILGPVDAEMEEEPNGSASKATELPLGTTFTGYVNNKEDLDVFRIQPESVDPAARYELEAEGIDGVRASLLVFRSNPKEATRAPLRTNPITRISGLGPITEQLPLYVAVSPHEGFHLSSRYRLKVVELPPGVTAGEIEPNDTATLASELNVDQAAQASIGWELDEDWFRVVSIPTGVARIDVTGTSDLVLRVRVYSGSRELLAETVSPAPGGNVVIPSATVSNSGLVVRISSDKPEEFRADRNYSVRVSWRDGSGEEREPNDSVASAKNSPLDIGIRRTGYIGHAKDVDHYEFRVDTANKGEILTLRLHAPPQTPLLLKVLKPDGEETLASQQVPGDEERTVTHYFESGVYVVQVRPASDVTNPESPYSLSALR